MAKVLGFLSSFWTKVKEIFNNVMRKISKVALDEKKSKIFIPVIAVILGFLVGIFVMLFTGISPFELFKGLLEAVIGIDLEKIGTNKTWFNIRYFFDFLVYSMPIILTGLSVAFAFRTGLFNIGAEGQLLLGGFGAVLVGITLDLPGIIHLPLAIITGVVFGALWGFVPGFLKARFNVHEVVVTIMMNYIALYTVNYFYKLLPGSTSSRTVAVHESATLRSEFIKELTNNSSFNFGFILVIIAVIVFWVIIDKTTFGFELKSAGFNKHASRYAGMKVNRNIVMSMVISGAFAGLAGVILSIGTFDHGRVLAFNEGYGFDGIAVALVGGTTAVGSLLAGLLFGALKASQALIQTNGVPKDIANIILASIVIFVAMQSGIKRFLLKFKEKEEL